MSASRANDERRAFLNRILDALTDGISPFFEAHLQNCHGVDWREHVASRIAATPRADSRPNPEADPFWVLKVLSEYWHDVFSKSCIGDFFDGVKHLENLRNKVAHRDEASTESVEKALVDAREILGRIAKNGSVVPDAAREALELLATVRVDFARWKVVQEAVTCLKPLAFDSLIDTKLEGFAGQTDKLDCIWADLQSSARMLLLVLKPA